MSVPSFTEMVTLEARGEDLFVPTVRPAADAAFVFGGQLVAQAVWAAGQTTTPDRAPHSLHAHFLAAAAPPGPLEYRVHRVRDGRSFSLRQVDVEQEGRRVFTATISYHAPGDAPAAEHQLPGPPAPDPDGPGEAFADYLAESAYFRMLDLREMPPAPQGDDGQREFSRRVWFKVPEPLGEDQALHASAIAFASDLGVTIAASVTAGLYRQAKVLTSLDHALWWHRPTRADGWTLLDLQSVSNSQQRGTVRGTMHTADGVLVASLGQETLIR